jgi:PPOX class probable F420-dependent enzyme
MAYTVNPPSTSTSARLSDVEFRAIGGQPAFASAAMETFLAGDHIAVLSYLRADGRPNQAPIWYAYRDGVIWFSVESDSPKVRALRKDPRVCVTIQDERPPYRAVIVEGTLEFVEHGVAGAPSAELGWEMAEHYFGKVAAKQYEKMMRDERAEHGTTLLRLVPADVKGFDNTSMIDKATLAFVRLRHRLPIPRRWL